jgi:hypothetical protein
LPINRIISVHSFLIAADSLSSAALLVNFCRAACAALGGIEKVIQDAPFPFDDFLF